MSVEVNNESGYDVDEAEFAALARYVLDEMHVHPQTDLSILLVGTDVMTDLHVKWMDEPGPTDVLSFPMDELRPGREGDVTPAGLLGDVVLCPEVAAQQARTGGSLDRRGAAAADDARDPAPARLRPRRAGGGEGDVRPPAPAAADVPGVPMTDVPVALLVLLAVARHRRGRRAVRRRGRGRPRLARGGRPSCSPSGTPPRAASARWPSTRRGSRRRRRSCGCWPR